MSLLISAHGLTNVNVLYWMVGICYYGFLVNDAIGLILVILNLFYCMVQYYFLLLYLNHIIYENDNDNILFDHILQIIYYTVYEINK